MLDLELSTDDLKLMIFKLSIEVLDFERSRFHFGFLAQWKVGGGFSDVIITPMTMPDAC